MAQIREVLHLDRAFGRQAIPLEWAPDATVDNFFKSSLKERERAEVYVNTFVRNGHMLFVYLRTISNLLSFIFVL